MKCCSDNIFLKLIKYLKNWNFLIKFLLKKFIYVNFLQLEIFYLLLLF